MNSATLVFVVVGSLVGFPILALMFTFCAVRYIPNNCVGIVEKLWSSSGSLDEGQLIATEGRAGYQAAILRGGVHVGYWRWQYRVHKLPLVTVKQGCVGYVFARDGVPLDSGQTLGHVVDCNNFQDADQFLRAGGQKGRQRLMLREGVYAINLAQFYVLTQDGVYHLGQDRSTLESWQSALQEIDGFYPVIIGAHQDNIGIVTCQDGPSLASGEIIAPPVGMTKDDPNFHNNYQDPEAFLRAGGRRGRQYATLTDGTYFINRWFATVELIDKKIVPIGFVGVVVSYYGLAGRDLSGIDFRHGERVQEGERGVWAKPLGPGKYPFNTYAGSVVLVPTTNFVLHWITGKTEGHRYDESLRSIDLVTKDAYEPTLPLSVVVHIDYQKAPNVIQRFGDVKQLITQTLDPMLSAYFRDVAHRRSMLELIHERDLIQKDAREELKRKFLAFDIECVDVLIGKPETASADGKIENLLDQLRQRQLATEQIETFARQQEAAAKRQQLNDAQAKADMQAELSQSKVRIEVVTNDAEANLSKSRKQAEQTIILADAESKRRSLEGQGESERVGKIGQAEAQVLLKKVASFGDPRLYALSLVSEFLSKSQQPIVPRQVFMSGGDQDSGLVGTLLRIVTAEKIGHLDLEEAEKVVNEGTPTA
ncbi:MAG TPA: SPFH domain-containing protein [Planctomycetaceae bacterium]|nr:SPFH domain-containing protein [Planctomycetaceae bacterium]